MSTEDTKAIDTAINEANDAMYHLDQADQLLAKAKNWGIADILGGGFFISAIKHQKINNVRNEIEEARRHLDHLETALNRMDLTGAPDVYADNWDFLDFIDVAADNFIADLMTQSRLSDAKKRIEQAIDQLNDILDDLEVRRDNCAAQ